MVGGSVGRWSVGQCSVVLIKLIDNNAKTNGHKSKKEKSFLSFIE